MLTLNDGRSELWQWDTGRTLAVDADCSQVHFSNKVFGRSIGVDVVDGAAIIPDALLQTDKDLNVWAFVGTAENGYTKISKTFKVNRRNKPADYVFTPTEQTTIAEIAAIAQSVRNDADAGLFGGVQPDWNQNDSTAADYVKNRPFYTGDPVETVLVEESTVSFSNAGGLYQGQFLTTFEATVGETYKVYWDGAAYESACVNYSGYIAIGNLSVVGAGSDTGEPFVMLVNNGRGIAFYTADASASHTFSISEFSQEIAKIDEKYLPISTDDSYGVIKKSDIVSVYNFPRNAPHDQMVDAITAFENGNASIVWDSLRVIYAHYESSDDTISVAFARDPIVNFTYENHNGFYAQTVGSITSYRTEMFLSSSTTGSTKRFKITVDDSGTISATEVL